jgi:hypothetical protein
MNALLVFPFLTDVETLYRTMIAHNSGVDQTLGSQMLVRF